jgi:hypothetical protein
MKYILQHIANYPVDQEKLKSILNAHSAIIIDQTPKTDDVLIEMNTADLLLLQEQLAGSWKIYPEKTYQIPTTQKIIK